MADLETFLQDQELNDIVDENALMDVSGEDVIYMPLTDSEESLKEEDFPKYTKAQRAIIASLNDALENIETKSLFATDDKVELTAFEKRILELINKE